MPHKMDFPTRLINVLSNKWVFLALLVVFVAVCLGSPKLLPPPCHTDSCSGINLQLAYSATQFKEVLRLWEDFAAYKHRVEFDFLFILLYSAFFASLFIRGRAEKTNLKANWPAFLPIAAGIFDVFENIFHLTLLRGINNASDVVNASFSSVAIFISSLCSTLKYALLLVFLVALIHALDDRFRLRERVWPVVYRVRFSLVISIILGFTLLTADQSIEALRVLAEDPDRHLIWFPVATIFYATMSWYWARVLLYVDSPTWADDPGAEIWAVRHLPRICGVIPIVGAAIGFLRAAGSAAEEAEDVQKWLTRLAIGYLILAVVFYFGLYFRRKIFKLPFPEYQGKIKVGKLPASSRIVLASSLALWAILMIIFISSAGESALHLGPMTVLMVSMGTWIPVGSTLVFLGHRFRLPLLTCLVLLALLLSAADLNDNHEIRHATTAKYDLGTFNEQFKNWLNSRADKQNYEPDKYPVIFVSAEGGGLRAAYFTAYVLSALQDQCPAFAQHVFVISGVSGGSLGAVVFGGLAKRFSRNQEIQPCNLNLDDQKIAILSSKADEILAGDLLSPLLADALYPDMLQRFLPTPIGPFDRARALEIALENSWADALHESNADNDNEMKQPLLDLWDGQFSSKSVPALFLNTVEVETGDRMVVSNLRIRVPGSDHDDHFSQLQTLADLDDKFSFRASTAACLSARFPIVTPAGYLIGKEEVGTGINKRETLVKHRYVDGGYFENSGTATLLDILSALLIDSQEAKFKPVVIRIGNSLAPATGPDEELTERSKYTSQGLGEIMSPVRAILNTREARGDVANREMKTLMSIVGEQPIEFQLRQEGKQVLLPLGWLLSQRARDEMQRQFGKTAQCAVDSDDINSCNQKKVFAALMNKKTSSDSAAARH